MICGLTLAFYLWTGRQRCILGTDQEANTASPHSPGYADELYQESRCCQGEALYTGSVETLTHLIRLLWITAVETDDAAFNNYLCIYSYLSCFSLWAKFLYLLIFNELNYDFYLKKSLKSTFLRYLQLYGGTFPTLWPNGLDQTWMRSNFSSFVVITYLNKAFISEISLFLS